MNMHIKSFYVGSIFFIFCFLYFCIIGALFWIQIVQHIFYQDLGKKQYSITLSQLPPRAAIIDRTGNQFLAINKESTAAFILPHCISDRAALDTFLKIHFPCAYARLQVSGDKKFIYVQRKLSGEQINLIKTSNNPDIKLLKESSRYYPLHAASCIIGITDSENNGLLGIEYSYNSMLAGMPTTFFLEKDARSDLFYFTKDTKISGCVGTPIQLTLDSNLQFLTYQAVHDTVTQFGAREGAALIMNPDTGAVLAMVNVPSFDPSHTRNLDLATTKVRAITEQYELGSVFKVFAALAALEEGLVTPDELIDCKNKTTTYIDGRRINTVHAHGIIPFTDVVALSNNIGIALVAKRLDERLYDHYEKLGFGRKTGIDISGESSGFLNPPCNWSKQSILSLSYGYEVSATLLQIASAFCLIARNGIPVIPHLIIKSTPLQQPTKSLYQEKNIAIIKEILQRTTQYGTAKRAAIQGYRVMSKTGTANMLDGGVYHSRKNRYTCAGIIEKGEYKRVIVTFIQEANRSHLYAATVAAPLFEIIAERMLIEEKIF